MKITRSQDRISTHTRLLNTLILREITLGYKNNEALFRCPCGIRTSSYVALHEIREPIFSGHYR